MNFLDKINSDFEYWKYDFRWDIIIFLIVSIIVLIFILIIIIIISKINDLKNEDIRLNLISNLDKDFINPNENKINEIKEIKENNKINII